jgi:hypothetical protein
MLGLKQLTLRKQRNRLISFDFQANEKARAVRLEFAKPEETAMFLSVDEELLLTRIVERSALK